MQTYERNSNMVFFFQRIVYTFAFISRFVFGRCFVFDGCFYRSAKLKQAWLCSCLIETFIFKIKNHDKGPDYKEPKLSPFL